MSANPPLKSPSDAEPEKYYQDFGQDDEIDLVDLLRPLWQQKIFILVFTFLVVAVAVILVFQATPQYRIYTQVKPGIYRWDKNNKPIPYLKTVDLKSLLSGGIFNIYAAENGLPENKIPQIKVANTRKGDQVTAYFFWPDKTAGRKLLAGFIEYLNNPERYSKEKKMSALQIQHRTMEKDINDQREAIKVINSDKQKELVNIASKKEEPRLVDQEKDRLLREIERIKADARLTAKQIKFQEERIKVAEETRIGYEKSRREIDANTTKIIALRDQLLQNPPDDSLQLLLLGSTIQQNIAYLGTLSQQIEAARKEIISYRARQAELIKKQEKDRLTITDLQDRVNIIALIDVVEYPQASIKPEKPKKKKIVALAGIVGLFLAIILAYLRQFWIVNREKLMRG